MILKNSFEVLKILNNSFKVLKVLENNLESMKLQENCAKTEQRRDRADFKQPTAEDSLPHDLADSDDEDLVNVDDGDDVAVVYSNSLPHDLADSDDEDLVNVDDGDDVAVVYSSKCHTPKSDSGGKVTEGEASWHKINLARTRSSLSVAIEARGDHAAHWANLLGEIVREFSMHFRSWHNIPEEWKTRVMGKIGGIEQHFVKIYTDNKSSLKAEHWVANPDDRTYDVEGIRSQRPANISVANWDAQSAFWSDPKNMERSANREYPSMIQTYFDTHSIDGIFLRDEERLLYGLGTYTDDQIVAIVRRSKQRWHIPSVGRVLIGRGRDVLVSPEPRCTYTADVDELKRTNNQLMKQMDMIMKVVRSDDKMSQLLTELQAQHEVDSGSGSGEGEDDGQ
nr:hypothetical protein [Tanacetum cinerariifolium]